MKNSITYMQLSDSIKGMHSARDKVIIKDDFYFIVRNKSKVIILPRFNIDNKTNDNILSQLSQYKSIIEKHQRLCFQYIDSNLFDLWKQQEFRTNNISTNNMMNLYSLISEFDTTFFNLNGKDFKEIRETKNQLDKQTKVICVKDIEHTNINNIDKEVCAMIDEWNYASGMKYRRTNHSGYDKNFFINYYKNNIDDYYGLFFYGAKSSKLIGYSIISKQHQFLNDAPIYSYIIRKCNDKNADNDGDNIRNLSLYIDYCSFRNIWNEMHNKFYIHWGSSKGNLLKYKQKFPIYNQEKSRFFSVNVKELLNHVS